MLKMSKHQVTVVVILKDGSEKEEVQILKVLYSVIQDTIMVLGIASKSSGLITLPTEQFNKLIVDIKHSLSAKAQ